MKIIRKAFSVAGKAKLAERAAKKALKNSWELADGAIGNWVKSDEVRRKQIGRAVRYGNTAGARTVRILGDNGKNVKVVDTIEYVKPLTLNHKINSKALARSKGNEDFFNNLKTGKHVLESDYTLKKIGFMNNEIKDRYEGIRLGTTKRFSNTKEKENDSKKKKHTLKDVKGWKKHSGLGYAILGGPGGVSGLLNGQAVAEEAEEKGKSDKDIIKRATIFGGISGAGTNTALHSFLAAQNISRGGEFNPGLLALDAAAGGAFGTLAARKNTKSRIKVRDEMNKNKEENSKDKK